MSASFFSTKVNYHKNGVFWWSKILNRIIGEKNYDFFRLQRRIWGNTMWYRRQTFLYNMNANFPDIANALGSYPKLDSSDGFPNPMPYECFRDFQENTLNSDGWFAMFVVYVCAIYSAWTYYSYVYPSYWIYGPTKNEEELQQRMKDYFSSAVLEESYGN